MAKKRRARVNCYKPRNRINKNSQAEAIVLDVFQTHDTNNYDTVLENFDNDNNSILFPTDIDNNDDESEATEVS